MTDKEIADIKLKCIELAAPFSNGTDNHVRHAATLFNFVLYDQLPSQSKIEISEKSLVDRIHEMQSLPKPAPELAEKITELFNGHTYNQIKDALTWSLEGLEKGIPIKWTGPAYLQL